MRTISIVLISLCLSGTSCARMNNANDLRTKVKGKWEVSLSAIPGTDLRFILDIREKDNALVFDIHQGFDEIDIEEMRFIEKDNKLSANLYLGEFFKLVIHEVEGEIKGSLSASMFGDLPLTLKKLN